MSCKFFVDDVGKEGGVFWGKRECPLPNVGLLTSGSWEKDVTDFLVESYEESSEKLRYSGLEREVRELGGYNWKVVDLGRIAGWDLKKE